MSASEDVPPLEDMSELIKQVDALRELKQYQTASPTQESSTLPNGHGESKNTREQLNKSKNKKSNKRTQETTLQNVEKSIPPVTSTETALSTSTASQSSAAFGGLKKGFLFGGSPKTKSVQENKHTAENKSHGPETANRQSKTSGGNKTLEDIPFVKKNKGAQTEHLRFSEVQDAMEKTNAKLMENKEWVTDDLLNKLDKNEKLAKRLQDPTFIQAIGEFQRNPQDALQKYGNNTEVQEFFHDFCGLMGEHFNKLGDSAGSATSQTSLPSQPKVVTGDGADMQVRSSTDPRQPTAADEAKMQKILSDPEIRLILMDPKIQDLFEHLRNDPVEGQRILQTASGELHQKIQRLVQMGLLQFKQN